MEDKLRIMRDSAKAFNFMHSIGIIHRDIKSHNILIDEKLQVKVCDFGLSKFKADLGKGTMQYAGTPTYMAPELFQRKLYNETID